MTEVTLEKGRTSRLIKKFRYEKKTPDKETKFHPHTEIASIFWKIG